MKTAHLTTLTTQFSPFSSLSKTPRLFLSMLPPTAYKNVKITQKLLPRNSPLPATLELGWKDGKVLKYVWAAKSEIETEAESGKKGEGKVKLMDIVEEVERHERMLARKEELDG